MTSTPVPANDESTWNKSVDLPIPGGPKSSVTEPATTPPPMTRSSSLTPVARGWVPSVETSASGSAATVSTGPAFFDPPARRTGAGPSVFHSPQAGQRPVQRNDVAVQAEQRNAPSPASARGRERGAEAMNGTLREGCHSAADPPGRDARWQARQMQMDTATPGLHADATRVRP